MKKCIKTDIYYVKAKDITFNLLFKYYYIFIGRDLRISYYFLLIFFISIII